MKEIIELLEMEDSYKWYEGMKRTGLSGVQSGNPMVMYTVSSDGTLHSSDNSINTSMSDIIDSRLRAMNDDYRSFYLLSRRVTA